MNGSQSSQSQPPKKIVSLIRPNAKPFALLPTNNASTSKTTTTSSTISKPTLVTQPKHNYSAIYPTVTSTTSTPSTTSPPKHSYSTVYPTTTSTTTTTPVQPEKVEWTSLGNDTYKIHNYNVKFPYEPYDTQATMIHRIFEAVEGGKNALLESATGTGKTLSLLCATLEWQLSKRKERYSSIQQAQAAELQRKIAEKELQEKRRKMAQQNDTGVRVNNVSNFDEFMSQFEYSKDNEKDLPKLQQDYHDPNENGKRSRDDQEENEKRLKKNKKDNDHTNNNSQDSSPPPEISVDAVPTIFFCSRTHSQIAQLTAELAKTPYRPKMCVLASRDHFCINPKLQDVSSRKDKCMKLTRENQCRFERKHKSYQLADSPVFRPGGTKSVWNIDDYRAEGKVLGECPFFASKAMSKTAELIFCPYNYIIDPAIRGIFRDKFNGSIVIFDEAHNIEDSLMSAASFDITKEELHEVAYSSLKDTLNNSLISTLASPAQLDAVKYLFIVIDRIINWINSKITTLTETDFEKQQNVWSGKQITSILEEMGLNKGNYTKIEEAIQRLMESEDDDQVDNDKKEAEKLKSKLRVKVEKTHSEIVPSKVLGIIEGISQVLKFVFEYPQFINDFRMFIQRASVYVQGQGTKWQHTFGIWAMNPRVAFKEISDQARSVILTSGTLAPLHSFSSELSAPFPVTAELGNLDDIKKRVWIGTLGVGINKTKMDATFKGSETLTFQDALGDAILKHIQAIPNGVLVFFPSYAFLEKMVSRWNNTGMMDNFKRHKAVHTEPKTSKTFPKVLEDYNTDVTSSKGALLLSVCRGKVSEGINFSDEYARGVIVVGIPLPNIKDLRVDLKKKYNDQNSRNIPNLISGGSWYQLQGFRALNQAIGRCIRHKDDYGSILLIDDRFTQEGTWANLSKWARMCISNNKTIDASIPSIKQFFEHRKQIEKDRLNQKMNSNNNTSTTSTTSTASTKLTNDQNDNELF